MKVKTLIELLNQIDGEKEVYLSGDEEGNYFGTTNTDSICENQDHIIIYPFETKKEL
jgi:hypothetical protein